MIFSIAETNNRNNNTSSNNNNNNKNGKKDSSSKFDFIKPSGFAAKSATRIAGHGQPHSSEPATKTQLLSTTNKAKKHKFIKKSLNPKLVKNVNKYMCYL